MKKYLVILFALLLPSFVLTSCGDDDPDSPEYSDPSSGSSIKGGVRILSVTQDPNMVANVSGRYYKVVVGTDVPPSQVVGFSLYYGRDQANVSTPLSVSSSHESQHTFNVKLPRNSMIYLQVRLNTYDGMGSIMSPIRSVRTN